MRLDAAEMRGPAHLLQSLCTQLKVGAFPKSGLQNLPDQHSNGRRSASRGHGLGCITAQTVMLQGKRRRREDGFGGQQKKDLAAVFLAEIPGAHDVPSSCQISVQ